MAGNAEDRRMRRMQMSNTHRIRPITMDLSMDAPLERDQSSWMLDDRAIKIEHEDVVRPHHALIGARTGTDEYTAGAWHADRYMPEHSNRALHVQHPRQCRGLFAQQRFIAHEN